MNDKTNKVCAPVSGREYKTRGGWRARVCSVNVIEGTMSVQHFTPEVLHGGWTPVAAMQKVGVQFNAFDLVEEWNAEGELQKRLAKHANIPHEVTLHIKLDDVKIRAGVHREAMKEGKTVPAYLTDYLNESLDFVFNSGESIE
jgi:hypothetical protein